jgi:hypothetical protein
MWFGMNSLPHGSRYGYELNEEDKKKITERDEYMSKEWMEKCRVKGINESEIKEWDEYVD